MKKPPKKLYKNQKEILEKFMDFINPFFKKYEEIKEAYLWGSLASGTFGIYERPYKNQIGSDIDLVLFLKEESKVPKEWKMLHSHSGMNVYKDSSFRDFKYRTNIHKVDLLVYHKRKNVKDLEKDNKKLKKKFFKVYPK